jgi:hypothetical protein
MLPLLTTQSSGETIKIDDFEDGVDDGWTPIDSTFGQPWGPGTCDASSKAYHLETTSEVPVGIPGGGFVACLWDASTDPIFSNGFVRAKVRADTEGSIASVVFRLTGDLQTGFDGYLFFGSTGATSPGFYFNRVSASQVSEAWQIPEVTFDVGEEWWIEAGGIADLLSMKVWRVGDPEPPSPQLEFYDSTYSSGRFGVESNIDTTPFPLPAQVSATFDDIMFTFPVDVLRGDFDEDGQLGFADIELLVQTIVGRGQLSPFDLTYDGAVDQDDVRVWVEELGRTYYGDADLDGEFSSQDLISVLATGQYEDGIAGNSTWSTGDWQVDGEFTSADLVTALAGGGYGQGPRPPAAAPVPEPCGTLSLSLGMLVLIACRRQLWSTTCLSSL